MIVLIPLAVQNKRYIMCKFMDVYNNNIKKMLILLCAV